MLLHITARARARCILSMDPCARNEEGRIPETAFNRRSTSQVYSGKLLYNESHGAIENLGYSIRKCFT